MSYIVLARKWRPAQFNDLVGQEPVVKTLMNAIRLKRIHHAYLFTGSRGIGKTSIARIFAKIIRCENVQDREGYLFSCDHCSSCSEVTSGGSVDVIEIDGASNNGVEAVREIRDNVQYLPATGSRKVYIIDEVHMLTSAAFNALLKTLEEPPSHIVFIFATTEVHKIPATILSRCQRFDYRRVTVRQIQDRLEKIVAAENLDVEFGCLSLLAQSADGSMRDALSLLDQIVAYSAGAITSASIREALGLMGSGPALRILDGIFTKEPLKALSVVQDLCAQGQDLRTLVRLLIEFLHCILLIRVGAVNSGLGSVSEEDWLALKQLAPLRSVEEVEFIFQVIHQGFEWLTRSSNPRAVLDVLLIKCSTAEVLGYLTQQAAQSASIEPRGVSREVASLAPAEAGVSVGGVQVSPEPQASEQKMLGPAASADIQSVSWEGFVGFVRKTRPLLASILEHAKCVEFPQSGKSSQGIILLFSSQGVYFKEQLQSRAYQEQLSQLSKEYLGVITRFQLEVGDDAGGGKTESIAVKREREEKERLANLEMSARSHPVILEAKALFGGELAPIEIF